MTERQIEYGSYPSLRDRVVVVTGGASGIGEKIVEQFAHQGARVAFLDIQKEAGMQVVSNIHAKGWTEPRFLLCDLSDIDALRDCVQRVVAEFKTVDVLVNNAGHDARHALEAVTPEYWDQAIAVNLKHQFFTSQALIPVMKKAGQGSIINLSSICWMIPSVGLPVYVSAKAAIVGLTRTLAHELGADNIRVNCVLPGAILTERVTAALVYGRVQGRDPEKPGPQAYDHARRSGTAGALSGRRRQQRDNQSELCDRWRLGIAFEKSATPALRTPPTLNPC